MGCCCLFVCFSWSRLMNYSTQQKPDECQSWQVDEAEAEPRKGFERIRIGHFRLLRLPRVISPCFTASHSLC